MYSYPPLSNIRTRNAPIGHPSPRYGYCNPLLEFSAVEADPLAEETARREELALNRRLQQLRQSRLGNLYLSSMDPYNYNDRLESLRLQVEEEEQLARLEALRQRRRELEEEERLKMSIAHHRRQLEEEEELLRLVRARRIAEEERSNQRHAGLFRPSTAEVPIEHYPQIPPHYHVPWDYLHQASHNECGRACCCQPSTQKGPVDTTAQLPREESSYVPKQLEPRLHQLLPQQSHHERLGKTSALGNDTQVVDVNDLLRSLGVLKSSAETPPEVAKVGNERPIQKMGGNLSDKNTEQPKADIKHHGTTSAHSAKSIPSSSKTGSSDAGSISIVDLGQILNKLANASDKGQNESLKASPSSSTTSTRCAPQSRPEKALEALKKQLEGRFGSEYEREIRDTIEGLLTSIRDNKSPKTSTSIPVRPLKSTTGAYPPIIQQHIEKTKSAEEEPNKIQTEVNSERTSRPSKEVEAGERINELEKRFYALRDQFYFPKTLDFVTPIGSSDSSISRLAYTTNSQSARSYAQALNRLLGELDLIDSQGNDTLRMKRKEVVKKVERALEDLEQRVEEMWKAQNEETRKYKTTIEDITEEEETREDENEGHNPVPGTQAERSKDSPILEEILERAESSNLGPATASVTTDSLPCDRELDTTIVNPPSTGSTCGHIPDAESTPKRAVSIGEADGFDHIATQEDLFSMGGVFEVDNRQGEAMPCELTSPDPSDLGTATESSSSSLSPLAVSAIENIDKTTDSELVGSANKGGNLKKTLTSLADEIGEQDDIKSHEVADDGVESVSSEQWSELEAPMQ